MEVWPAIDLRGGKCVRLQQGDYTRETVFGDDPAAIARHWVEQGARRLHLVDLDGAREGRPRNRAAVAEILNAVSDRSPLPPGEEIICELGGGIRDEQTIRELLAMGLQRLVIGTSAIKRPDWFRAMCRQFPRRLVLGIDARDGKVAVQGWLETSELAATDVARQFAAEPLAGVIYTDIATDGMLAGPNCQAMAEMRSAVDLPVIASGGVTTIADVAHLAAIPMAGCIIGRALYEATISLPDALAAAGEVFSPEH